MSLPALVARFTLPALLLALAGAAGSANALELTDPPSLREALAEGKLPAARQRMPENPLVVTFEAGMRAGKHGGTLQTLIGRSRDVRLLVVNGYARLVGYDRKLDIKPDILESVEVREGRIFTFKLRRGHKWSDGQPFTAEDFRYYWEDVANNPELSPGGPPRDLLVDGEAPKFEILDPTTVRYTWSKPNPDFLPKLAGASPLFTFRPAHYLKKFHKKYTPSVAEPEREGGPKRRWAAAHNRQDNMYQFDNPALPTLQPWMNTTKPPADRFVAVRNPYFHRVDPNGLQLPYIDKVVMVIADSKLIPAKTGAGEADLQARDLQFNNYTFLKKNEKNNNFRTLLWHSGNGSQFSLFPNLNVNDPVWRKLLRDVRLRRALSLAIDRPLINSVIYFGLAAESNNTMLLDSPLARPGYRTSWAKYDPKAAAKLLDEIGLRRGLDGFRRLPDGRPLEIIVETAGESSEQADVLELIGETWRDVGVKLFTKPSQRDTFRKRIFSGETVMSVWTGFDNGIATADMSPEELAPSSQMQLQWPKFGQYHETSGRVGEAPDISEVKELAELYRAWRRTDSSPERERIWHRMLSLHAEQQFTIGVISSVPQPVVVRNSLRNVPAKGFYNFEPGAFFGIYRPETFWFE